MAANTPEHLDEWEVAKNYLEDTKDMTLDDFQALPEDDVLAVCTPLSLPCKGRLLKLYKANKATGVNTVWAHLDVPLPALKYDLPEVSTQDKSTTVYAVGSMTPTNVTVWGDFQTLIAEESSRPRNDEKCTADVALKMGQQVLSVVRKEEDVTQNTAVILNCASDLLMVEFCAGDKYTVTNTDIAALRGLSLEDQVPWSLYASPSKGTKSKSRKAHMAKKKASVILPMETKPNWKYHTLSDKSFASEWEVPEDWTDGASLPTDWTKLKKNVFHLVRQSYGQMASDNLRYGVIHTYEKWWFCRRDSDGSLAISGGMSHDATSPSVLQALRTLLSFDDWKLDEAMRHEKSPVKEPIPKDKSADIITKGVNAPGVQEATAGAQFGSGGSGSGSGSLSIEQLLLSECRLLHTKEHVKILATKCGRGIAKMARDPRMVVCVQELRREAEIYEELQKATCTVATPTFYGFTERFGVPLLLTGAEGPDFEEIGVENLPFALKLSAVRAVQQIAGLGILHGDIALRNVVRSKLHPHRAKIIDFGRARMTTDKTQLEKQVTVLSGLLNLKETSLVSEDQSSRAREASAISTGRGLTSVLGVHLQ